MLECTLFLKNPYPFITKIAPTKHHIINQYEMKTKTVLSALLIILLTNISCNQNFNKIKQKAEEGDATAQYELAVKYYMGEGTKVDEEQAFKWMEQG